MQPSLCPLLCDGRANSILLPAPVHEHEEISFGLSAPTTSTTVALALCDALALAIARRIHTAPGRGPADVFKEFHPGGAIGAALSSSNSTTPVSMSTSDDLRNNQTESFSATPPTESRYITDISTPLSAIPLAPSDRDVRILDVLRLAIQFPAAKSWVLPSPTEIIPPRSVFALSEESDVHAEISSLSNQNLIFDKKLWFSVTASMTVREVQEAISKSLEAGEEDSSQNVDSGGYTNTSKRRSSNLIVSVVDEVSGEVLSVIDSRDIFNP